MGEAPQTPLRQVRVAAGLTLRELERRTGINRGRLSIIERGVSPTAAEAGAILRALATSPEVAKVERALKGDAA
jgi:transcriptional regulator with XRE-family HTH domain